MKRIIDPKHNPVEWALLIDELSEAHEHLGRLISKLASTPEYDEELFRVDIQMTIDDRPLTLVDKMSRAREPTRSASIRLALEAEIQRQRVREEEARHAEGYARIPVASGEFDVWSGEQDWGT